MHIRKSQSGFSTGDKVYLQKLTTKKLQELSAGHGEWNPQMERYICKIGVVQDFTANGDVVVEYLDRIWRYNPAALTKIQQFKTGDEVVVKSDKNLVKELQKDHGGWNESMISILGRTGKVLEVDSDGDIVVSVEGARWMLSPAAATSVTDPGPRQSTEAGDMDSGDPLGLFSLFRDFLRQAHEQAEPGLVFAAQTNNLSRVKEILDANPEKIDELESGHTALHVACHQGHCDIIRELLERGANRDILDNQGYTAMHHSTYQDRTGEALKLLLEKGFDPNARHLSDGSTPLHLAVKRKNETAVRILTQCPECNVDVQDEAGDTPLHDAISLEHHSMVDMLLDCPRICLTLCNRKGFNFLQLAVLKGNKRAVERIFSKTGNALNVAKSDGFTTLHIAAVNDHREIAKILLKKPGCEVNAQTTENHSALHLAAYEGYSVMVEILLDHGANVNAVDDNGDTALHITLMKEHNQGAMSGLELLFGGVRRSSASFVAVTRCLLSYGADVFKINGSGETPLDRCRGSEVEQLIREIAASGRFVRYQGEKTMAAALLSDFMPVPIELKGYVIGGINEMAKLSGTTIDPGKRYQEGFTILGSKGGIKMAKQLISKKLAELNHNWDEPVEIPDRYKDKVIGIGKANLRKIETQTGVRLSVKEQEIFIVHGTEQQRRHAKMSIGKTVAVARVMAFENKVCSYVDGCHLPVKCKLKLEEAEAENPILLPGSETQYRLKPAEHCERKDSYHGWNDPAYQSNLLDEVLMSLRKIKDNMDSAETPKADIWCYLGTCIIRAPDEDDVLQQTWEIEEVTEKFQRPDVGGNFWKVSFTGRDDIPEDIFQSNGYKEITKGDEYISRYDLTYLTPCFYHLRCMVWVAKSSLKERLEDVPIPGEVNNLLEEIYFEDEMTRTRCRGWLVLKSRRHLKRDILFPGCELDCRFIVHERRHYTVESGDVPKIEVRHTLSTYLSRLTLTDENAFGLRLPDHIPDGFHLLFKRYCKRKMYSSRPEFSATLSQVNAWWIDSSENETNRESTELHLHSEECEKLFNSTDWQPEIIVQKLPAFLNFVREIRGFVEREMKENGSKRTVPPEIRARGPLALEAYNNALAEGQTCVKRVPLMFVGQDRSGKTSLKKSLKGICFNPDEDSTLGIAVDNYHFKVTTEIWMTGKKDQDEIVDEKLISFEHNAARWIADKLMAEENVADVTGTGITKSEHYDDFEKTDTLEGRYPSETTSYTDPSESPTNPAYAHPSHGEPPLTNKEEHDLTPTKYGEDIINRTSRKVPEFEDIAKVIQQILQDDLEDDREDIHSIMWDFAGQSVYYVTHPIFLTRRAIYFLVYDLSRNPSDKAIPLVRQGVYREIEDKSNLKTNMDYLVFWMSSLASLVEPNNRPYVSPEMEVLPKKLPAVFLVCTHADKPYCNRNSSALAREIFGYLKTKPYGAQLFDVFCVDNTKSGTESECQEIMRLREVVHKVAKNLPHVNEAIPIKWLKYENALRLIKENDCKFISLSTAKEVASNVCKISKNNEMSTLLNFLHDLRVLIHFSDTPELSDLVILDPQWLIDIFKSVITVRPYHSNEKNFAELWSKLETEGILEEKLLKHVWNSLIPKTETHESLIAMMERFSLLCPWPTSQDSCNKHYLVPSMLQTHPPKMISNLVESAQLPSLFIKFIAGQVPPGLFPRFESEFFQWCRKQFPRLPTPQFYKNFARYYIYPNQGLSIVFLCHSSAIEVVALSANNEFDMVDMTSIRAFRSQLTWMIDRIWNKFFWVKNVGYKVCFLCPICSHGRVVSFCKQHNEENCKEEECLHFISESDLGNETSQVFCTKSATARDNRIQAEDFAPWISPCEGKVVTGQRYERPNLKGISDGCQKKLCVLPGKAVASIQPQGPNVGCESDMLQVPFAQGGNPGYCQVQPLVAEQFEGEFNQLQDAVHESKGTVVHVSGGYGEKSLVLPYDVSQSLQSESVSAEDVVCKLLDLPSLRAPAPEDRKWIRCLMRDAKDCYRTDVVTFLRKNAPAGTTGPLLEESLSVLKIPIKRRTDLAVRLCGGDEWKIVADKLGFEDAYIRCFDQRFKNPVDLILQHCKLDVGQLYDVLVECEFPALADLL